MEICREHGIRWRVTLDPVRRLVLGMRRQLHGESWRFLARHLSNVEHHVDFPITAGNRVSLLDDGPPAFVSMIEAIDSAVHHVHCETFTIDTSGLARRFLDALVGAARRGVRVRMLYDDVGSLRTTGAFFRPLVDAGAEVVAFNPLNPFRAVRFRPFQRNHRKLLIVDGRVAFTGGMNVCRYYASGAFSRSAVRAAGRCGASGIARPHSAAAERSWRRGSPPALAPWRDTHARIEGAAVAQFQQSFVRSWRSQRLQAFSDPGYFPPPSVAGQALVHVLEGNPLSRRSAAHGVLASALRSARRTIDITVPYFVPDRALLRALAAAACRGVRVRLLVPARSDFRATVLAGRALYRRLARAGVEIYERADVFVHAKTMVVDGVWCTLGSCNWDSRSLRDNHELNAMVISQEIAAEMTAHFERDIRHAVRQTIERCERLPVAAVLGYRLAAACWRWL